MLWPTSNNAVDFERTVLLDQMTHILGVDIDMKMVGICASIMRFWHLMLNASTE